MKRIPYMLLFILSVVFFFTSCDKMDCNDGLDGQWQMYEWKSPNGDIVATQEMQLYYSFQLQMMMFQKLSVSSGYLLSSFQNMEASIRIYDPIKYKGSGHDEVLPMDTLSQYGVPLDGIMEIEELSANKLVLYSPKTGRLSFRKY